MIIAGYISSFIMGIILGLMGGGGSILTTPVMVYLMGVEEDQAPFYSFFVVGVAACVGTFRYFAQSKINFKMGMLFGTPSVISVFLVQHFVVPSIPKIIIQTNSIVLTKGMAMMGLFAVVMLFASWFMLRRKNRQSPEGNPNPYKYSLLMLQGAAVGILTGLIGIGGGFLIVPALVILCRVPLKEAAGTSLMIIALNSTVGFSTAMVNHVVVDWNLLLPVAGLAILGMFTGVALNNKIPGQKLRPMFGYFTLVMGFFILFKTFVLHH